MCQAGNRPGPIILKSVTGFISMADPTTITVHPRYSDFDRDGQLHTANYMRYMLQVAIDSGAIGDLNTPGLDAAGWLEHVGDFGVSVSDSLVFGDVVEIQTRLKTSGPPVWRREFTLRRAGSGAHLADGFVDLFKTPDDEDEDADEFGVPESAAGHTWDGPAPPLPAPPDRAFRSNWRVPHHYQDISGGLDPACLIEMAADMHNRAAEVQGWGAQTNLKNGLFWIALEQRLELFNPIEPGELLEFLSYIGEVGDDYVDWYSIIGPDGSTDESARARIRWACISAETGQRQAVPNDWVLDMADLTYDVD
jgi:acyl-CoA thioesterase FadM